MIDKTIILEGERVRLEPLSLRHAEELFASGNYDGIWKYMTNKIETSEDMIDFIHKALANKEKGLDYPFAVYDKEFDRYIGSTRYLNISPQNRNLEIGWTWYTPSAWRTRVNTECKYLLLKNGFEEFKLLRIQLKADSRNERSHQAILRIGAVHEGVLRNERILHDGYIRNANIYSIIDTEWPIVKTKLEGFLSDSRQ